MKGISVFLLLSLTCVYCQVPCSQDAKYRMVASCEWTNETHPTEYPTYSLHFSPMCGTVHNGNYSIWKIGGTSTPGVKLVSELGNCYVLEDEIEECAFEGNCQEESFFEWICNPTGDNPTICNFEGNFTVSSNYSMISMLSMLAPSPDWNVGINSLDLCQSDDEGSDYWLEQYPGNGTVALFAWDAGTDGGKTYESNNVPLEKFQSIRRYDAQNVSNIFFNQELDALLPICEVTIELLDE